MTCCLLSSQDTPKKTCSPKQRPKTTAVPRSALKKQQSQEAPKKNSAVPRSAQKKKAFPSKAQKKLCSPKQRPKTKYHSKLSCLSSRVPCVDSSMGHAKSSTEVAGKDDISCERGCTAPVRSRPRVGSRLRDACCCHSLSHTLPHTCSECSSHRLQHTCSECIVPKIPGPSSGAQGLVGTAEIMRLPTCLATVHGPEVDEKMSSLPLQM